MTSDSHHVRRARASQAGFTIIEVMVAAFVLLVGLLGVIGMLDVSILTTGATNARVGATNLERELLETARGLSYDNLTPTSVTPSMQARGLGTGSPWTIVRRGVSYTVTASACTFDSPANGLAATPPANICTPQPPPPAGTGVDPGNGDDFRRVTFQVAWTARGTTHSVTQSELIINPTGNLGPQITNASVVTAPILSSTTVVTVTFTTSNAVSVHWHADDGTSEGDATCTTCVAGSPQTWTANWSIGTSGSRTEVLDGTYQIIAQAFDSRGFAGDSKLATVAINRRQPYAPLPALAGGIDTLFNIVDLAWGLNAERDVLGYRVYRAGSLVCPSSGGASAMLGSTTSNCSDLSPVGGTTYTVVAIDRDTSGNLREGDPSALTIVSPATTPPLWVGPLSPSTIVNNLLTLSWTPPSASSPVFYRVYRDGTTLANRYDRTAGSGTTWSDTNPGTTSHQYWVTAVDSTYNESAPLGPVS